MCGSRRQHQHHRRLLPSGSRRPRHPHRRRRTPVSIEVIEQRTVGATLGDAAIEASIEAAIIGIALTGLFIILVYRVMGLMASIALGSLRPYLVRDSALARRDPDPARAGRLRARHRTRHRRQRACLRASPRGVRAETGRLARQVTGHRLHQGLVGDPRLQHHDAAGCRTVVLPGFGTGEGIRRHAVHRCRGLDDLGPDRGPSPHRPSSAHTLHREATTPQWVWPAKDGCGAGSTRAVRS